MTFNAKTIALGLACAGALLAPARADLAPSTRPRYERRLLLETTSETSANASIGDVDGLLDIVLAKGRHWPADFNHDGFVDLAVPHREGGQSYVDLGAPKSGFSESRRVPIGNPAVVPYALAVADLDGNGATDIIVGNVKAPAMIHFNNGAGKSFTTELFGDDQGTVHGFAIADLDRDGWADIAVARSEAPNVVYFGGAAAAQATNSGITRLVETELAALTA